MMTEVLFPYQQLRPLVRRITRARHEYLIPMKALMEAKRDLARAERGLEKAEALTLFQAYEGGLIDGRNSETRKAQEKGLLAASPAVEDAREAVWAAQEAVDEAELALQESKNAIERQADEISLTRAWLYAQSKIG